MSERAFNLKGRANTVMKRFGYQIRRFPDHDLRADDGFMKAYELAHPYTMTSVEKMYSMYNAVRHVSERNVPGAIVECGVWKGGSTMIAAEALRQTNDVDRDLYLYDTFEGMTAPTEEDRNVFTGDDMLQKHGSGADLSDDTHMGDWLVSPLSEVKANMALTKYPQDKLNFVQGKVEDTIPGVAPDQIAVLRLDTDWYASTLHELEHLYPRLVPNGILILDDYRAWGGSRDATDQYFDAQGMRPHFHRIDRGGAVTVKK